MKSSFIVMKMLSSFTKLAIVIAAIVLLSACSSNGVKQASLCDEYLWSDVEELVRPYLDDVMYTALVMQGQSAGYNISVAASEALAGNEDRMPVIVVDLLQDIDAANCVGQNL